MSSAIYFNLDQSKILFNGLIESLSKYTQFKDTQRKKCLYKDCREKKNADNYYFLLLSQCWYSSKFEIYLSRKAWNDPGIW